MSNFLASVVRRGAGLPSPVNVRPAVSPENIPAAVPRSGARTGEPVPAEHVSAQHASAERFSGKHTAAERFLAEQVSGEPAPQPLLSPSQVRPAPRRDQLSGESETRLAAEFATRHQPAPQVFPRHSAAPADPPESHRAHFADPARPTPAAARADSGQSAEAVVIKPERSTAPAAAPLQPQPPRPPIAAAPVARPAPESRSIQVKIGKVEIRSTPPANPSPVNRPRSKGGFDEFSLSRNYLDRGNYR